VYSQELKLMHYVSSDQTYHSTIESKGDISIYLHFYEPGIRDYSQLSYYYVVGWYRFTEKKAQKKIIGIYYPGESLTLYVPENEDQDNSFINNEGIHLDTIRHLEKFFFPLQYNSKELTEATWSNESEELLISNIDVDKKNRVHKIYLTGKDWYPYLSESIDITDFIITPFGANDIINLEDFQVDIYQYYKDSAGNWHLLLRVMNEYVTPASFSSGGYYYLEIDKTQLIREATYYETYKHGKYESVPDEKYQDKSRQRFLVQHWSDEQVLGSYFIENATIMVEKEW